MLKRCAVMGAVALFSLSRVAHPQCQYEITAVIQGPSCGIFGPTLVELLSINDLGQACGWFLDCATDDRRPFAWSEETGFVVLALPPGATRGEAKDINNVLGSDGLGQIACTLGGAAFGGERAFLYDDGEWTELPPQNGGNGSSATAVNDQTQVVGTRSTPSTAFRWEDRIFVDIQSTIGGIAGARDVNQHGDMVGFFGNLINGSIGFCWSSGILTEIPPIPGALTSEADATDHQHTVVGFSRFFVKSGQVPIRAWRFEAGKLEEFPNPDNSNQVTAVAINDSGQVLIRAGGQTGSTAYLWQQGEMVLIADLVVPLDGVGFGSNASAINNAGQIGAVAAVGTTNAGIILTPKDVPLGDVNFDCAVDHHDLAAVLRDWGPCSEVGSCICDIVTNETFQPPGDGVVDGADLAVVLANWTGVKNASASKRRR